MRCMSGFLSRQGRTAYSGVVAQPSPMRPTAQSGGWRSSHPSSDAKREKRFPRRRSCSRFRVFQIHKIIEFRVLEIHEIVEKRVSEIHEIALLELAGG